MKCMKSQAAFPRIRERAIELTGGWTANSNCASASGQVSQEERRGKGAQLPGTHTRKVGDLGPLLPAVQQGRRVGFIQSG